MVFVSLADAGLYHQMRHDSSRCGFVCNSGGPRVAQHSVWRSVVNWLWLAWLLLRVSAAMGIF